jgi:hypothetical protein
MSTLSTVRTDEMTSRERLAAAMRGEPTDHPPFAPFLAYFWEAQPAAVQEKGQLTFLKSIGADQIWRGAPGIASWETPGLEIRETKRGSQTLVTYETPVGTLEERYISSENGNTRYLVDHAVKTSEQFKILAWMEEHTRVLADDTRMKAHFAGNGREGLSLGMPIHVRQAALSKSAFQQLVEHWVGTVELTYAIYDRPHEVQLVLDLMMDRNREAVKLSAAVDEYEYFLTFEDSSTQNYSPDMYEQYIGSEIAEWQRILGAAGKSYVQHGCGHLAGILPAISAQHIWGVESLTPPETGNIGVAEVRAQYGLDFGIIGGIEPVRLAETPEEDLPDYVDAVLEANAGGRFILANADSCPPSVRPSKLKTIADHVRRLA